MQKLTFTFNVSYARHKQYYNQFDLDEMLCVFGADQCHWIL